MSLLNVRVKRRTDEAEGVCSFELVSENGAPLPSFTAGAHIDVNVAPGLTRQYSLCNDPQDCGHYRIAVLREPQSRGGSAGMHERVQVGDLLQVSEPRNHFRLTKARKSLLMAGGIGVTPILAMAKTLHVAGETFEMHYCGRSAERMAFLHEIAQADFANPVFVHTDDGAPEQKFAASQVLSAPSADTHLYVCGPSGFMEHVLESARKFGWSDAQLHREYFAGSVTAQATDGCFDVRLARSKKTLSVPADKSVLDILLANGVDIPVSCEAGVCGTCLTRVLEGTPDHRDTFLTDAERAANDQFTPCCSRAMSPLLVLDI